jgi:hypothetical protein
MDQQFVANLLEIKDLANLHGIEVRFVAQEDYLGQIDPVREIMYLGTFIFYNRTSALSTFFHELSHITCVRTSRFKAFHRFFDTDLAPADWRAYNRTQLRAEQYVDKLAAEELRKYDSSLTYETSYTSLEDLFTYYESPKLTYDEWYSAMRHILVYGMDDLLSENAEDFL